MRAAARGRATRAVLAAGFDIGGTNIRAEVVGASSIPPIATLRRPRPASPDGIVEAICDMVGEISEALGGSVAAVGVGCAGLVNRAGVVATSPNIPEIRDFPLRAMLAERTGRPVAVDNDATAALRAEMTGPAGPSPGTAAGAGNVLLVTFGTGIGAALAIDGEIRRGAGGLAGEAGHMIVAPGGPPCPCGRSGCWERLASGEALGRMARTAAGAGEAPALAERVAGRIADIRGEHVGGLAAAGDRAARRLLRELAGWVALGLNNLILVLSPEVVVLGGGLSGLGDVFVAPVREALDEVYVERDLRPPVALRAATHGDRAGAIGAALLALDLLESPEAPEAPQQAGAPEAPETCEAPGEAGAPAAPRAPEWHSPAVRAR